MPKHPPIALLAAPLLLALACSDAGPGPDPLAPPTAPLPSHRQGAVDRDWQPGNCPSPYFTLTTDWAHDATAADAADVNGNGNLCIDQYNTGTETYLDDQFRCGDGEDAVFLGVEGHPVDEPVSQFDPRYNGALCVDRSSGIAFDDCTGDNQSSEIPEVPGDDELPPTIPPLGLSVAGYTGGTCSRPAEYDDHEPATCPEGYGPPFPASAAQDAAAGDADGNGNGLVCWSDGQYADDVTGLTLTEGRVNGHGNYEADGATLSFSFHARSDGADVRGTFEFHDRDAGSEYHGTITCLESDGETVHLEGMITNPKDSGLAEGSAVAWTAVDNGEGHNAPADEVSQPEPSGDFTEPCSVRPSNAVLAIDGGNIQVR